MTCDRDHALLAAYGEGDPCPECRADLEAYRDVRRAYADAAEPMTAFERARLLRAASGASLRPASLLIAAAAAVMLALLPAIQPEPEREIPSTPLPAPVDADISAVASRLKSIQRQPSSLDRDIETLRNRIRWTVASIPEDDL